MAYEYGSEDLGIRNPFRFEGAWLSAYGLVLTLLGCWALFSVQGRVASDGQLQGVAAVVIGGGLLVVGLRGLGKGLFQVMRFFVGRSVPANLALPHVEGNPERDVRSPLGYSRDILEAMVLGRKNPTFQEPSEHWVTRAVYSVIPDLLFLPYQIRGLAQLVVRGVVLTGIALLCYGLTWFSVATGLANLTETYIMDWLGLALGFVVVAVWLQVWVKLVWGSDEPLGDGSISSLTLTLLLMVAILIPVGVSLAAPVDLPPLPLPVGKYVGLGTGLAILFSAISLALTLLRSRSAKTPTEVSEYRDNWQESVHPQDIFINFRDIAMANRRYKEIPNRVYKDFDPTLREEGSDDKGNFNGKMIHEVQPVYQELDVGHHFKLARKVGTVLGCVLLVVAAFLFYLAIDPVSGSSATPVERFDALAVPALLALFGSLIIKASHVFWAEVQFTSLLVYFKCSGTYTESKVSTGASIYDSTRSENTVVRSSMTPWIVVTRFVTSTLAGSGRHNLEDRRYVLEMHKDEGLLEALVSELQGFLRSRQVIADVGQRDLEAAALIHQVNEQTRSTVRPREQIELPRETTDRYLRGPETDEDEDEASQSG